MHRQVRVPEWFRLLIEQVRSNGAETIATYQVRIRIDTCSNGLDERTFVSIRVALEDCRKRWQLFARPKTA
jgi:hypothetical protein